MKSTTRNLLCAIAVAPVVALLAGAPAAADDGPLASLLQRDGAKGSAADLARPVLGPFPYLASDAVRTAGTARIDNHRNGAHEATSLLGPTTSQEYGLQAQGIGTKCVAPAQGPIKGTTVIEEGRLQGQKLPEHPAVNQQIPLREGAYAILNKQVRNADGFVVIGTQFVDKLGRTTDLAKIRCVPPKKAMAAQRRVPNGNAAQKSPGVPMEIADGGLDGLLKGVADTLFGMQGKLDTYLSRKSPISLSATDALGRKIEEAAAPSIPGAGLPAVPGAKPQAGPHQGPRTAPRSDQRQALAPAPVPEPEPKLLGQSLLATEADDVLSVLKGSGTNGGLKSSLFEKKDEPADSTEAGLFGGLPGLSQLPANVSDLLQGYSLG